MSIVKSLHSLYGRKVGVHIHGYLLSQHNDVSSASTSANLNSSTAARLPAGDISISGATAATTYIMDPPIPGVRKEFWVTSTEAVAHKVELASGNFQTNTGSSYIAITFNGVGEGFTAIGLTTALMQIIEHKSTAALTTT